MLKYMLDTNIVINTMKKKPASVRAAFKKDDGRMGNSSITSITEPSLLLHRERSITLLDLRSSFIASAEQRSITEPSLLLHRERSVVIHFGRSWMPTFYFTVWQSY